MSECQSAEIALRALEDRYKADRCQLLEERAKSKDQPATCEEHLVVKDTFHMVTGKDRIMPGDCYCVRCSKPVPYVLRNGQGWPVQP